MSPELQITRLRVAVRDFLFALDRGYLACKDDSAFIDDLRVALAETAPVRAELAA